MMKRGMAMWVIAGVATLTAGAAPPVFVPNYGQWVNGAQFHARMQGQQFMLSASGYRILFVQSPDRHGHTERDEWAEPRHVDAHQVLVSWPSANFQAMARPLGRTDAYYNYFLTSDTSRWRSQVPGYKAVLYEDVFAGIDVKFYSEGDHVKYDWIVKPGGEPAAIALEITGADRIRLVEGDLVIDTSLGTIIERAPVAYQLREGKHQAVPVLFELEGNRVCLRLPQGYDPCETLFIDPLLIFSTYSGSTADNWGSTATPGERGTLYSSGITNHQLGGTFPATPGAFQMDYGGLYDVAILKYDSTGSQLLYASYLGGSGVESPHSLVINESEDLWVLGTTGSLDFPTTDGALRRTFAGGSFVFTTVFDYANGADLFVTRISRDGSQLLASTYLGGSQNDGLNPAYRSLVANYGDDLRGDIVPAANGDVLISTVTSSPDFPVANGAFTVYQGGRCDALVVRLDARLSNIIWATFLGGDEDDAAYSIKITPTEEVWVAGGTTSPDFPTTPGVYQTTYAGATDGWIARLSSDGATLDRSTFTGTPTFNQVYFIDVSQQGEVYAYGQTVGTFPITPGVYHNPNSGQFLQKFSPGLDALLLSTVIGAGRGIPDISPTAFLVNDCNNIFLSGWGGALNSRLGFWNSSTIGLPVTPDAFQRTTLGSDFYFLVLPADASEMLYATFLGGTQSSTHVDGGTSRFDKAGVVYHAVCSGCANFNAVRGPTSDFPTTPNAWRRLNLSDNCNNAAFKFDLSVLRARLRTNSVALNQPGLNRFCIYDTIVFENFSTGGKIFRWSFGDGRQRMVTTTDTLRLRYREPGLYTVKLVAIDEGTCIGRDSVTTTLRIVSPEGEAVPFVDVCFGSPAQLEASGGIAYAWTREGDQALLSSVSNPVVTVPDTTRFVVHITDVQGCRREEVVTVRVVPRVRLTFSVEKIFNCNGRTRVRVTNPTERQWNDENIFFDLGDGTRFAGAGSIHQYAADGVYPVRLVGLNAFCEFDSVVQVPIGTLKAPNVMTPAESPGFNDTFQITDGFGLLDLPITLKIVNRWGKTVYSSSDYRHDWAGGDQPPGVYFYEAIINQEAVCKGWLHLVR